MILFKRTFRERCRDYFDKLRLVQAVGVAVLLGLLWWKSKTDTEAQLRDQVNFSDAGVIKSNQTYKHPNINSSAGRLNVLHLHFLDIFINFWSCIRVSIRKSLLGQGKKSRHV